jgi:natural product precursor
MQIFAQIPPGGALGANRIEAHEPRFEERPRHRAGVPETAARHTLRIGRRMNRDRQTPCKENPMNRKMKRLTLSKETVKNLEERDLKAMIGGANTNPHQCSLRLCPSLGC